MGRVSRTFPRLFKMGTAKNFIFCGALFGYNKLLHQVDNVWHHDLRTKRALISSPVSISRVEGGFSTVSRGGGGRLSRLGSPHRSVPCREERRGGWKEHGGCQKALLSPFVHSGERGPSTLPIFVIQPTEHETEAAAAATTSDKVYVRLAIGRKFGDLHKERRGETRSISHLLRVYTK